MGAWPLRLQAVVLFAISAVATFAVLWAIDGTPIGGRIFTAVAFSLAATGGWVVGHLRRRHREGGER